MALTDRRTRGRSLVASLALALAVLGLAVPVVVAASPSVSAPTATATFLRSISFKADATLTPDVVRVELVVDVEGSTRSEVTDVPTTTKDGPTTLSYVLDTPSGDLLPNTDVTARFRLVLSDGTAVVGPSTSLHYDDTRYSWKIFSGEFVRVHYTDGGASFGQRAAKIGDDAIRQVSTLLGVSENEPIDFYVYADRTAFYDVLGPSTRENVGGEARPEIRTLFANIEPTAVNDPWVGIVIPHELTHLVFDTAVRNPYHYPPRWLNEGIAVYLSEGYGSSDRGAVADAADAGSIMPLDALAAQFPTTEERFRLAYSESVSAVSFLVDHYGRDAMVALVRSYKGGVSDDEAFKAALKTDVAGFEAAWLAAIGSPAPSPFGPKPAPAGPLPSGWGGAAPTAGTAPEASTDASASAIPTTGPAAGSQGGDAGGSGTAIVGLAVLVAAAVVVVLGLRRRQSFGGPGGAVAGSFPTSPAATAESPIDLGFIDAPPPTNEAVDPLSPMTNGAQRPDMPGAAGETAPPADEAKP